MSALYVCYQLARTKQQATDATGVWLSEPCFQFIPSRFDVNMHLNSWGLLIGTVLNFACFFTVYIALIVVCMTCFCICSIFLVLAMHSPYIGNLIDISGTALSFMCGRLACLPYSPGMRPHVARNDVFPKSKCKDRRLQIP